MGSARRLVPVTQPSAPLACPGLPAAPPHLRIRHHHRSPPAMRTCSGDVPGDGTACGATISLTPSGAAGFVSRREIDYLALAFRGPDHGALGAEAKHVGDDRRLLFLLLCFG